MQNFLDINDLTNEEIQSLINLSLDFKNGTKEIPDFKSDIATLFLEASTRTKTSFELAAVKTGNYVVNIEESSSALTKGESFQDTLDTLGSLGIKAAIIRSSCDYYYQELDTSLIKIINAGDGAHAHPSQSLLDLVTIYEHFGKLAGLNILIMGDILHSRVAHSNIKIMQRLGMNVTVYAPSFFKSDHQFNYVDNLEEVLPTVDIVMLLRNQLERHQSKFPDIKETYLENHGLTLNRAKLLSDDSIIMHPGPFNRDVEISSDVLKDKRNKINQQVTNGLYTRMAIIEYVFEGDSL